ncbi:hypothetical protein LMG22037_05023 [Paraburkholderia phenoliruptrix]|jgi:copper chaperone|uniref:HMA domain-containing protein n=1 Tax=Paraburkholderia phenoliruptrix TaxID=252970 RepID=A0A6J5C251_9BURK|nr:heavy-metal-associated domain-containing protein [Paraburkholderia phenoliruptrix]CAB3724125.1 hypothetical protein LMG22037_05023 [Paraburkholderia phenoliruptrix]
MELEVKDMTCGHCADHITKAVKNVDPSATIDVNLNEKRVTVASALPAQDVLHAVSEAGYSPVLIA